MQADYRRGLADKAALLSGLWAAYGDHLLAGQDVKGALSALYEVVHRLAGSAGSYGFDELSVQAKRLEADLTCITEGDTVADLDKQYENLQQQIRILIE